MDEKQTRSYAKESTKSKPSGIRFDLDKVEFVKTREKLNTFQKVVDFLLNKYWWEFKVAKPTYKEAPPLHLKEEEPKPVNQRNSIWDEQPKQTILTVADYKAEKRELDSEEDYNKWLARLNADTNISKRDKDLIIKYN